jgi:hypothetical protein
MFLHQLAISLNKKLHVFEFAYKKCGISRDSKPIVYTNYLYVIAQNKKDAEQKAREASRARSGKYWGPEDDRVPVFHRRVHIKYAMERIMNLYVSDSVSERWSCKAIANKAALMRGAIITL